MCFFAISAVVQVHTGLSVSRTAAVPARPGPHTGSASDSPLTTTTTRAGRRELENVVKLTIFLSGRVAPAQCRNVAQRKQHRTRQARNPHRQSTEPSNQFKSWQATSGNLFWCWAICTFPLGPPRYRRPSSGCSCRTRCSTASAPATSRARTTSS